MLACHVGNRQIFRVDCRTRGSKDKTTVDFAQCSRFFPVLIIVLPSAIANHAMKDSFAANYRISFHSVKVKCEILQQNRGSAYPSKDWMTITG